MTAINTTLTTSGNSVAVRLPKELLRMSGLKNNVRLEAKRGKIIISKSMNSREGWSTRIKALIEAGEESTQGFDDMNTVAQNGLDSLPWDGPSFEEWQKTNGKLS